MQDQVRIIKFRIWNPKFKEFNYWGFMDGHFKGPPTGSHLTIEDCSKSDRFTGLLDKNGKEIYEGDMMNDRLGINRIVIYDDKFASFHVVKSMDDNDPNPLFEWTHFEVIGNIYSSEPIVK